MQIRVSLQDISETDALKLKKIFKLSASRKKNYIVVEEKADLLITANPVYKSMSDIPVLTLGSIESFPDSKVHIKPPLLGIRVLKILDSVEIAQAPMVAESDLAVPIEQVPETIVKTQENGVIQSAKIAEPQNSYNILVVDDSVLIHKALELELQQAAFAAKNTFVVSGEQCLDTIRDKKFELIFLDVMMPGIDGYETCTEIRKNPLYKKTPIIMLSSKTSPLDEVKGVMAGCTTYLTKPIKHEDFQKLLKRMDKWLENFNPPTLKSE